jgi:EAL domain-containing protein (putative c-di-GMP-specific phosphodiesterase class I)
MDAEVQARRALEIDLRAALTNEEFQIHYQPLVSLREEGLIGFEALLRWRSARRGMVRPADFIPLAEEMGLIVQIGEWVLAEACRHAAAWPEPLKVAVNISTVQFNGRNLLQTVIGALEESGLKPERLELEITESVMVQDFDAALATLHDLRNLGVSISMDDFGTGYSSLSYLRSFPFDRIKIDQSFVRELGQESDSMPIIRAVLGMCESLGIPVTAEGVETQHQLRLLSEEGCNDVQGFLISEPRPVAEVAGMIRDFSNQRPSRFEFSQT